MLVSYIVRIIGRSYKHSLRSIIGFALIITMMVAISGVISGFSVQIFGITQRAGESSSLFLETSNVNISSDVLPLLIHPNIQQVMPILERDVNITTGNRTFQTRLVGINVTSLLSYYVKADVIAGSIPSSNSSTSECLAGSDLQSLLESSIINVTDASDGIFGTLQISGLIQGIKEFQSSILLNVDKFQLLFDKNNETQPKSYQKIKISLKNGVFIKETISDLYKVLEDFPEITIKPEQQTDIFADGLFSDIVSKLNLLFTVLFIIALIRESHAISWFVRKYERDLLIMRSFGLSSNQLFFLILFLAEIIGLFGFFAGFFFGILIPSSLFTLLTLFFEGGFFAPDFNADVILILFVLSNIVSIAAGLFPATRITRKSPGLLSLSTHGRDR